MPTVIVLAAGRGERFKASGGQTHKLQALLNGEPVLSHVLRTVQASGLPWHKVTPQDLQHLPHAGMGDSIASGVAATVQAHGWLILPADLPLVHVRTLLAVAQALQRHPVVMPRYQGQAGHPVGFGVACRAALLQLTGDEGARSVLAQHPVHRLDVDDEGCVLDVDTVDALALAHTRLQKSAAS